MLSQTVKKAALVGAIGAMLASGSMASAANVAADDAFSYGADTSQAKIAADGTMTIPIYLKETLSNGAASLVGKDGGLGGAGFKVAFLSSVPVGAAPATITGIALNDKDFAGGPTSSKFDASSASGSEGISTTATTGVALGASGQGAWKSFPDEIYLGSVNIMPGAADTTFSVGEYSAAGGNTLTLNNFYDLDVPGDPSAPPYTGVGTATATVAVPGAAVPEPASLGLLGLSAFGLLARRRSVKA